MATAQAVYLRLIGTGAALALLALSACGGSSAPVDPATNDELASGISAGELLPQPSDILRSASFEESDRITDADNYPDPPFDVLLPNQNVTKDTEAGTATFSPSYTEGDPFSALAFAPYGFDLDGYSENIVLRLQWAAPPTNLSSVYVAFADWSNDRWRIFRLNSSSEVEVGGFAPYIENQAALSVTTLCYVIVTGEATVTLDWLRIGANVAPIPELIADPSSGVAPLTVTFTVDASDQDSSITSFELDVDDDGVFEYTSDSPTDFVHEYTAAGPYTARLLVTDSAGGSASVTADILVTPDISGPPHAPINLNATDGTEGTHVLLTWDAALSGPTPDSYRIYRADSEGGPYVEIDSSGTDLTYQDFTADAGVVYWYHIIALLAGQPPSTPSNNDSGFTGLFAPNGVEASDGTFDDFVRVTWFDPVLGPTPDEMVVLRAMALVGPYTELGTVAPGTETFDDTTVDPGMPHWYTVVSRKAGFPDSAQAEPDSGMRNNPGGDLQPPTINFVFGGPGIKVVTFSHPSSGETPEEYDVYRSTSENGTYIYVGTEPYGVGNNDFQDVPPDSGTYWYKMKSVKGVNESVFSNAASG